MRDGSAKPETMYINPKPGLHFLCDMNVRPQCFDVSSSQGKKQLWQVGARVRGYTLDERLLPTHLDYTTALTHCKGACRLTLARLPPRTV